MGTNKNDLKNNKIKIYSKKKLNEILLTFRALFLDYGSMVVFKQCTKTKKVNITIINLFINL